MVILKNHARGLSYFNHSVMFHKYLICSALLLMGLHDKLVAQEASLILHHARIYTMDVAHPQAEAVAVRGDRILKVGTNAEVMQHKGTATKLIDGKGAFVMPGLIEGHGHIQKKLKYQRNY
jgi:adenine deaminase